RHAASPGHAASNGNAQFREHFRSCSASIQCVRTEVESIAVAEMGDRASTQITPFFEEGDGAAAARKIDGSCKPGDASADHDDVVAQSEARWYRAHEGIARCAFLVELRKFLLDQHLAKGWP